MASNSASAPSTPVRVLDTLGRCGTKYAMKKCCFCWNLSQGSFLSAVFSVALVFLFIGIESSVLLFEPNSSRKNVPLVVIVFLVSIALVVTALLLVVAAAQGQKFFVIPWLVTMFIAFIVGLAWIIIRSDEFWVPWAVNQAAATTLGLLIFTVITVYCFYCVASYLLQIWKKPEEVQTPGSVGSMLSGMQRQAGDTIRSSFRRTARRLSFRSRENDQQKLDKRAENGRANGVAYDNPALRTDDIELQSETRNGAPAYGASGGPDDRTPKRPHDLGVPRGHHEQRQSPKASPYTPSGQMPPPPSYSGPTTPGSHTGGYPLRRDHTPSRNDPPPNDYTPRGRMPSHGYQDDRPPRTPTDGHGHRDNYERPQARAARTPDQEYTRLQEKPQYPQSRDDRTPPHGQPPRQYHPDNRGPPGDYRSSDRPPAGDYRSPARPQGYRSPHSHPYPDTRQDPPQRTPDRRDPDFHAQDRGRADYSQDRDRSRGDGYPQDRDHGYRPSPDSRHQPPYHAGQSQQQHRQQHHTREPDDYQDYRTRQTPSQSSSHHHYDDSHRRDQVDLRHGQQEEEVQFGQNVGSESFI